MPPAGGPMHPVVKAPESSRFLKLPEDFALQGAESGSAGATFPQGFLASGMSVGLKGSGRPDIGILAVSGEWREVATSAALFTPNAFAAAPVVIAKEECDLGGLSAVVVNSGNANACTGPQGLQTARSTRDAVGEVLGLSPEVVAVSSTGVIGEQIDAAVLSAGARQAAAEICPDGGQAFARSIMTTDRFPKVAAGTVSLGSGSVRVGGCAKGAGMIAPALATMLCYLTTDAVLSRQEAARLLEDAAERTFNRVTVDGEMSTNDSVFLLASGASGIKPSGPELQRLAAAVEAVMMRLALMMVADGEGATKIIRVSIEDADTVETAETVARAVADSPLVKTAMNGNDPNWGRIMSSAGAALPGRRIPNASLQLCGVTVVERSAVCPLSAQQRKQLATSMREPEVEVCLKLGLGTADAEVFFSDLGHDYVTINADYHS